MERSKCVRIVALVLLFVPAMPGQSSAHAPSANAANASPEYSIGPFDISGLLDAYYSLNFNHPASRSNQLRNFDVKANQFSLNMAKLTIEHPADPAGFRLDLGFGRAFDIVHSSETGPAVFRNIEQAYVTYKPPRARGLQLDLGKFVTSAGAEVIETNKNWNYSRSLLFTCAIPYYHFGLRAAMPVTSRVSAGLSLINGWNNVEDNNSGKTVGLVAAFTTSRFAWTQTYYVGAEKTDGRKGLRHLYDTTLLVTPASPAAFYLNFDYGVDKDLPAGNKRWVGVAGAARFALSAWLALAPRLEWLNDADGFTTGTVQKVKEVTLTAEFKMKEGLLSRLEYRRDWSNAPFFDRGAGGAVSRQQDTLLAGVVAYFGPGR